MKFHIMCTSYNIGIRYLKRSENSLEIPIYYTIQNMVENITIYYTFSAKNLFNL